MRFRLIVIVIVIDVFLLLPYHVMPYYGLMPCHAMSGMFKRFEKEEKKKKSFRFVLVPIEQVDIHEKLHLRAQSDVSEYMRLTG